MRLHESIRCQWNPEDPDYSQIPSLVSSLLNCKAGDESSAVQICTSGKYVCTLCGYIYDPAVGDPANGIPAGTAFEDLPDTWRCPVCGASKDLFKQV